MSNKIFTVNKLREKRRKCENGLDGIRVFETYLINGKEQFKESLRILDQIENTINPDSEL